MTLGEETELGSGGTGGSWGMTSGGNKRLRVNVGRPASDGAGDDLYWVGVANAAREAMLREGLITRMNRTELIRSILGEFVKLRKQVSMNFLHYRDLPKNSRLAAYKPGGTARALLKTLKRRRV